MGTKVAVGQVWKDTYDYKSGPFAQNPPTLTVTEVGEGYAMGVRQPSGKKTKLSLAANGGLRGYALLEDAK